MTKAERWFMYEMDPVLFATARLGMTVDTRQAAFLRSTAQEILLLWARQVGKTTGSAVKVTHKAIFSVGSLTLIVSATQRQAGIVQKRVLQFMRLLGHVKERWRELPDREAEIPEDYGGKLVRCSSLSLELANGSEVISVPANADTVRGYSPQLIVVDECRAVKDSVYYAVEPMRAVTRAQLVCCSSAGGQVGWFYEAWKDTGGAWWKSEITARECPRITSDFLDGQRRKLPDGMYQQEYENVFMAPEGALLTPEQLDAAQDERIEMVLQPFMSEGLSDVAEDETVEMVR